MSGITSSTVGSLANHYPIGSTGPGGGIVFYDAGSVLSWGRYLEAATTTSSPSWNDTTYAWSGNTNTTVGTSTTIGSGLSNTNAMVTQDNTANRAGTICRSYTGGGKTDWFLPSKDELNQLYLKRTIVGGFVTASNYWSSSEGSFVNSFFQYFNNGFSSSDGKSVALHVRPIRAF